jgi:CHASE3 domain sensor protein
VKISSVVAIVLVAIAMSVGAGFGAAQATQTSSSQAATTDQVVTQLQQVNSKLSTISSQLGSSVYSGDGVRPLLQKICGAVVSGHASPYSCH